MITHDMIKAGYDSAVIKLISSPSDNGIAAQIGDNYFYFGGHTATAYDNVDEYKDEVPKDVIVQEIFDTLNDFAKHEEYKDEYDYYSYYLNEQGITDEAGEALTAGLIRELIKGRNIPDLERLVTGKPDHTPINLINLNDYIATKLWTREDIAQRLYEMDYPGSDAYIDEVLNHGTFKRLEECSDNEWNIIDEAIREAANHFELPKTVEVQGPISYEDFVEFPFKFEEGMPQIISERLLQIDTDFRENEIYIISAFHRAYDSAYSNGYYDSVNKVYALMYHGDSSWENVAHLADSEFKKSNEERYIKEYFQDEKKALAFAKKMDGKVYDNDFLGGYEVMVPERNMKAQLIDLETMSDQADICELEDELKLTIVPRWGIWEIYRNEEDSQYMEDLLFVGGTTRANAFLNKYKKLSKEERKNVEFEEPTEPDIVKKTFKNGQKTAKIEIEL